MSGAVPQPLPYPLPRTWRPRLARLVGWTMVALLWVVTIGVYLLLPRRVQDAFTWPQRITGLVFLLLAAAVMHVVTRGKVVADRDGLTVVNMVRTRRLEWAEVLGVRLAPGDPWVMLDLSDGTTLPATGIQASDGARARRQAAELRALAAALGEPPPR